MSSTVTESAGAKINLCLFVGPVRGDGRHEIVTLFDSVDLADELVVEPRADGGTEDEVVCGPVPGQNLVADALAGLRAAGWTPAPLRVEIDKRIPVAAGMGGGSADAAAMLRCAPRLAPVDERTVGAIAASLGADVPAQLTPGPSLGTGAGETVAPVERLDPYAVLVVPHSFGLSTPAVYAEADRLGSGRTAAELAELAERVRGGVPEVPPPALMVNDLQAAALSLRPEIAGGLVAARSVGADAAIVCGSGPTVIGVFTGPGAPRRAREAAGDSALRRAFPGAVAVLPTSSAQSGSRL